MKGIDSPIHISGNITGLPTGKMGKHGLHVHQHAITDLSDNVSSKYCKWAQRLHLNRVKSIKFSYKLGCKSSGGHFNPTKVTHGNISDLTRHVGDYGNVLADENGVIQVNFVDSVSQLWVLLFFKISWIFEFIEKFFLKKRYGPFGIIGRTMVLHKNEDDLGLGGDEGSKATGNAGDRIACGMIGIL